MDGYTGVLLASLFLLVISIINEKIINMSHLENSTPTNCDYIFILICRYFHYIIYTYTTFYLFFFWGIGKPFDIYLYLITVFVVIFGWYVFDSCWLSFYELLYYKVDLEKIDTRFHPTFHTIFVNNSYILLAISGILLIFTVSYVLYKTKAIPMMYKILYYILFWILFVDGTIIPNEKKKYYSCENNQLALLKETFDNYMSKLCDHCVTCKNQKNV